MTAKKQLLEGTSGFLSTFKSRLLFLYGILLISRFWLLIRFWLNECNSMALTVCQLQGKTQVSIILMLLFFIVAAGFSAKICWHMVFSETSSGPVWNNIKYYFSDAWQRLNVLFRFSQPVFSFVNIFVFPH